MSVSPRDGMWGHVAGQSPDPAGVLTAAERIIESLNEADADRLCHDSQALTRIAWFVAASPCLVPFLARHPRLLVRLFLEGDVESGCLGPQGPGGAETFLAECKASQDPEALARHVAVFRNSHMVRLYSQEVLGLRPPPEVWAEWSEVAALCIQGAMGGVKGLLPDKGEGVRVAVMGMGKLGGRELNFASDIDLMFLYEPSDGTGLGDAREEATSWAKTTKQVLERVTGEGPCFRVDLGLRPGGKDGDLVATLDAAEIYYQTLASPWERWALIKVNPVAGDGTLGHAFVDMVRPFVFRRYLDYGSLSEIRTMKERIQRELRWKRGDALNVKMGEGGIREIEFLVQTLQIINGGKQPALRVRDTLGALRALADEGLLTATEAEALGQSYVFLRGVEHRVQMVHHLQTHTLPVNDRDLKRISALMGYRGADGVEALLRELRGHMTRVHDAFDALLSGPDHRGAPPADPRLEQMLTIIDEEESALGLIEGLRFRGARAVRESIRRILSDEFPVYRSPAAREALYRLLPGMLTVILRTPDPDQTLFRLERFLEAVGPRGGYYSMLEENPRTLEHLIELFGRSALLSRWVRDHLEAVEVLVEKGHYRPRKRKDDLFEEGQRLLFACEDQEERLARLRVMRVQEMLRIGVGELRGALDPWEAAEELSDLAEVLLDLTLREALRGADQDPSAGPPPLCILGLGSFGGRELSYKSDLDIMFVYDNARSWRPPKGVAVSEQLTRVAQRCLSWMAMPMREGPGWTPDVRLRPSGTRGPLMVSLEALEQYHADLGRVWERQTLLKARPCAGEARTGEQALEMISDLLARAPTPDVRALHGMRLRMERERGSQGAEAGIHLKLGPGGMADIEFSAQYCQLMR
ncbi:MAG: bifunctional [glutamate--ammonia ligase]-adenylyl-L-tyrosine phosphorylase/[glutamate--ammonia-ligase] adenylyltransferase, partial [Thermodesulfobacteriota bacterium]